MSEGRTHVQGSGAAHGVAVACAVAVTVLAPVWILDVPGRLGVLLYGEQFLAVLLGITLTQIYLRFPVRRGSERSCVPPWDVVLAGVAGLTGAYVAWRYPVIAANFIYMPVETLVLGAILVPLSIEALRRVTGWSMVVVALSLFLYAMYAHLAPGLLEGRPTGAADLLRYSSLDSSAMLGRPLTIAATVVVAFILMGQLLLNSGGARFFTDLSAALMGRQRGGAAKISIVGSSLFGTISGSAISNVVSTGVITIPLMKRSGYSAPTAAAVEASASTGGQLMPPIMGAVAFVMAEFLQVPYTDVMIAAIVPAMLYYCALLIQVDLEAAKRGLRALPSETIPRFWQVMREGWHFIVPFVVVLWTMFWLKQPPELAALWAALSVLLSTAVRRYADQGMSWRALWETLVSTGQAASEVIVITAVAGMIIGLLNQSGLAFSLSLILSQLGGQSLLGVLALTAVICIVLGMSMPTISLYILVAVMVAPALVSLGVEPMAAHLFVLYFGLLSMVTPPVALCAFTAATIAQAPLMRTGFIAMRLSWTAYLVPFLFVYSPELLLDGPLAWTALAVATALIGVWLVSGALVGYLVGPLGWPLRLWLAVAGVGLLVPARAFHGAIYVELIGAVMAAVLLLPALLRRVRQAVRSTPGQSA